MADTTRIIRPCPVGWVEYDLSPVEIDYLWERVNEREGDHKPYLIGHVSESNTLVDKDNWFFDNVLLRLVNTYIDNFQNLAADAPINSGYAPFYLEQWWSNHSKAGDFNPCHKHCNTIFSFAIWLRIPTNYDEQNNNPIASNSNSEGSPRISTFEFQYTDIMGTITPYTYKLCSSNPVSMVLFPGQLIHTVYPFYNCDEDRVSIAGNIGLDTRPGYSGGYNG